jgi:DNA-3-methyladenine glycosylase I
MSKIRCFANKPNQSLYANYHDHEWGFPTHDDNKLFEILSLEIAQAGLSFETILKKRAEYQEKFYDFNIFKVASLTDNYLKKLLTSSGIIKHQLKIQSTRHNAKIILQIQKQYGTFNNYIWSFVNHETKINKWKNASDIPSSTSLSMKICNELKRQKFKFIGPVTIYSFMQASGMVCDHFKDCCYWD